MCGRYSRVQRKRAIHHKAVILSYYGQDWVDGWTHHGQFGRLSKNKIHCSCWMCRSKSYDSLSHKDMKAEAFMNYQYSLI